MKDSVMILKNTYAGLLSLLGLAVCASSSFAGGYTYYAPIPIARPALVSPVVIAPVAVPVVATPVVRSSFYAPAYVAPAYYPAPTVVQTNYITPVSYTVPVQTVPVQTVYRPSVVIAPAPVLSPVYYAPARSVRYRSRSYRGLFGGLHHVERTIIR